MLRLLLIQFVIITCCFSQTFHFNKLTTENGLSNNLVGVIKQDRQGFIWFATENGLNRFDGINFTTYQPFPGCKNCIPGRNVKSIFEDSKGRIWVSFVTGGVSIFNPENEQFTNFRYDTNNSNSLSNNEILCMYEDKNNNIFIGTNYGLNLYNEKSMNFIRILIDNKKFKYPINTINTICQDKKGVIWVGTEYGIYSVNIPSLKTRLYIPNQSQTDTLNTYRYNHIVSLFYDSYGVLWVGTLNSGLYYITDSLTVNFNKVKPGNFSFLSIIKIYESSTRTLFVTHGGGLSYLLASNRNNNNWENVLNENENRSPLGEIGFNTINEDAFHRIWVSISGACDKLFYMLPSSTNKKGYTLNKVDLPVEGKLIRGQYVDRSGVLWVNITKLGVWYCDLNANPFHLIQNSGKNNTISSNEVYSVFEDQKRNVWVGTSAGLNIIDNVSRKVRHIEKNENFKGNICGALCEVNNNIYVGFFDGQISKLSIDGQNAQTYSFNPSLPYSNIGWSTRAFAYMGKKLFFSSFGSGLIFLDTETSNLGTYLNTPVPFRNDNKILNPENCISSNSINCLCPVGTDTLLIGTINSGLNILNIRNNKFTIFKHAANNTTSLSDNEVTVLSRGRGNYVWVGTGAGGLNYFDLSSQKFSAITTRNGLPDNSICGVIEDNNNNVWISSTKGLSKYNRNTRLVYNYTQDDGLQANDFTAGAFHKGHSGYYYFGGSNGVSYFSPDSIKPNTIIPQVVFTKLKIFDKVVNVGDTINGSVILTKSISLTSKLILTSKNNEFTIEFAALHYVIPSKNKYKYMLKGFDMDWKDAGSASRWATYTRLPAGKYVFRVIASNNDGYWNKTGASLQIIVMPPWYKTIWFRFLICLLLLVLIILFNYQRTKKLEQKSAKLEKKVTERTLALQKANNEILMQKNILEENNTLLEIQKKEIEEYAHKLHESDQSKIRLFTNISHELRTSITLISGPSNKLMQLNTNLNWDNAAPYVMNIHKNSLFLNKMVNQLLDYRKVQEQKFRLNIQQSDFTDFIKEIETKFSDLALENKQNLSFNYSPTPLLIWFDADVLEIIFSNLLSNAIKYTQPNGYITVYINYIEPNLTISIKDNGEGISEDELPYLFEPFTQLQNTRNSNYGSSGLGLAFTKELVVLHKGNIEVLSKKGEGSEFKVSLAVQPELLDNYNLVTGKNEVKYNNEPKVSTKNDSIVDYPKNNKTILVVEDNTDLRNYISSELTAFYNVIEAANGSEGLIQAVDKLPDLIISDIMMPVMDGIELCRQIKNNDATNHIPFIFLTAQNAEQNQLEGLITGADDYIMKPFNMNILLVKVHNYIENRGLLHKKFGQLKSIDLNEIVLNSVETQFLSKLHAIIESNIDSTNLDAELLADLMGMSASNLYRKLKVITGISVNIYIRNYRVKKAAEIFQKGMFNISEAAYSVGFNAPNYFSRSFAEVFNQSPTEYIKNIKKLL